MGFKMNNTVSILDPVIDDRWDRFVAQHPFGWICHTRAWKEILEISFKHIRANYLFIDDEVTGEIKAALPLCYVKSWIIGNRLVSLPFATFCDPLVSSDNEFKVLFDAAVELKKSLNCRKLEIRAFKTGAIIDSCRMSAQKNYKTHYLNLGKSPQKLLKEFHYTSVRQRIRQAEKSGLEVYKAVHERDLKAFYRLYIKTRKRLLLPPQPYAFFRALWGKLYPQNYLSLLLVKKETRTIGGLLLLKFKDRVSAEFLAIDEDFIRSRPNHLLIWAAIQMANQEGYHVFDFGRTAAKHRGLMDFKGRWGTKTKDLIQIFSPASVTGLPTDHGRIERKIVSGLCRIIPEPAFSGLGSFCYRHLG